MKHKKVIISSVVGVIIVVAIVFTSMWVVNNNQTKKFATVNGHDLYKVKITKDEKAKFSGDALLEDKKDGVNPNNISGIRYIEGKTKAPDGSAVLLLTKGNKYISSLNFAETAQSLKYHIANIESTTARVKDGKFKVVLYFLPSHGNKIAPLAITGEKNRGNFNSPYNDYYKAAANNNVVYHVTNSGKLIEP